MNIQGVLETSIYTADLQAAEKFYGGVLGLELITREAGRHVFFRSGRGVFLVFDARATSMQSTEIGGSKLPLHGATGPSHMAFAIAEKDYGAWKEKLGRNSIAIESEIRWPNGGLSIYFRDPAGNSIELATPKLWAKWQRSEAPAQS